MTRMTATFTTLGLVGAESPLDASALANACGATQEWVVQAMALGIVQSQSDPAAPQGWHFFSQDLHRAREARHLERKLAVELDVAALILDLQFEMRRLKSLLAANGHPSA